MGLWGSSRRPVQMYYIFSPCFLYLHRKFPKLLDSNNSDGDKDLLPKTFCTPTFLHLPDTIFYRATWLLRQSHVLPNSRGSCLQRGRTPSNNAGRLFEILDEKTAGGQVQMRGISKATIEFTVAFCIYIFLVPSRGKWSLSMTVALTRLVRLYTNFGTKRAQSNCASYTKTMAKEGPWKRWEQNRFFRCCSVWRHIQCYVWCKGIMRAAGKLILFLDADGATNIEDFNKLEAQLGVKSSAGTWGDVLMLWSFHTCLPISTSRRSEHTYGGSSREQGSFGGKIDRTGEFAPILVSLSMTSMLNSIVFWSQRSLLRTILMHGFHQVARCLFASGFLPL